MRLPPGSAFVLTSAGVHDLAACAPLIRSACRQNGRPLPERLDALLTELCAAATEERERAAAVALARAAAAGSVAGSEQVPSLGGAGSAATSWMTTAEVAEMAGVSVRAVTKAIDKGRLPARRDADRSAWEIRPEDATRWTEGRRGRGSAA